MMIGCVHGCDLQQIIHHGLALIMVYVVIMSIVRDGLLVANAISSNTPLVAKSLPIAIRWVTKKVLDAKTFGNATYSDRRRR